MHGSAECKCKINKWFTFCSGNRSFGDSKPMHLLSAAPKSEMSTVQVLHPPYFSNPPTQGGDYTKRQKEKKNKRCGGDYII